MGDLMKIFVTKKVIKIPRYKLWYIISIFSIALIIILNFLINIYLKRTNIENLLNFIVGNSTGNVLNKYNMYKNKSNIFYKNIYGFNLNLNTSVSTKQNNIEDIIENNSLGDPLVYLYNTFQTDKYKSNYYNSYTVSPLITESSLILKEYLKDNGINSVVETNSVAKALKENNLKYSESYKGSRILLEKAFKKNTSLKYFFDLTLSSKGANETTTIIEDIKYAKILFVIGTDNKNFKKNLELANSLNDKLGNINGKLSRGISMQGGEGYHGVYNQDFNQNAMLIQVGGKENTIDEVNRTLKILAKVLTLYIMEDKNEKK